MVEQRSGAEISFIKKALLDYPAVADREHRDFAVWSALPGMGDQHVGEQRKVITGHERPVETQVLYAVGRTPAQVLLTHRFDAAACGIATVRQRARFDADHVFGPVLLAGGAELSGQPQCREVGRDFGGRGLGFAHGFGRASSPKSASTRSYQASSSSAPQATQSSSLMAWRQSMKGAASGPTGCLSCIVSPETISTMLSATSDAGVGFCSELLNNAAMRFWPGYEEPSESVLMRVAIDVSMMPGSTIATRISNGRTSWARHSDSASSAYFDAAYGPMGEPARRPDMEVTLTMQPLRLCRIDGRTALMHRTAPR